VAINGGCSSSADETREEDRAPAARAKRLESTEALRQNPPVGFNPFRQQRRRSTDYLMVAAAFAVVAVLLIWAALPR